MNAQPISTAKDRDLRLSEVALQRAAKKAREVAVQTGTHVVVSRNGRVEYLSLETPSLPVQPAA